VGKAERLVVKSRPLLAVCRRAEILFLSSDPGNRHVEVSLIDISGQAVTAALQDKGTPMEAAVPGKGQRGGSTVYIYHVLSQGCKALALVGALWLIAD
jgi:hypothetical protein